MIWGADLYRSSWRTKRPLLHPGGRRRPGSDTVAIFSGAQAPLAAHLFINHLLDAQVSAENTNYIDYMGPNAAAKEFIDPAILADPAVTRTRRSSTSSRSCSTCPGPRDEYLSRWQALGRRLSAATGLRPARRSEPRC